MLLQTEVTMDHINEYFYEKYLDDESVNSIVAIHSTDRNSPIIDGFDQLVLVISKYKKPMNYISHYIKDGVSIQERWIHAEGLERWMLNGENRSIIQWILAGEVLLDKQSYLQYLRKRLVEFPQIKRKKKLFMEFSYFLRKYLQGKEYIEKGQTLDAYNNVLEALQHWGRICILESGQHPELLVWKQLKDINPGVYKLYEELTLSLESLEQRVRLVLLACEFSVISKMEDWCAIVFDVLKSRKEPWSANELKYHPDLVVMHVELALVLKKLQTKSLVKEVLTPVDNTSSLYEIRYTC